MVDRAFSEASLAELYDLLHPAERRGDVRFYLDLVMSARSVLDVGCGTGLLLRRAREAGHTGRLCGLDPADAMLDQARARSDIEWILGDVTALGAQHAFELIVMTGHAFQVFVSDAELRTALAAIRSALTEGGRFVFDTRNPLVRAWQRWTPENATEVVDTAGSVVRMAHQVDTVADDLVSFTTTFTTTHWDGPRASRSTLRFLDSGSVAEFLADAGLVVEEQFGDWSRNPLTETSPEIITIASPG